MKFGIFYLFLCIVYNVTISAQSWVVVDDFERSGEEYHGHGWESLNPGYWKIQDGALRRRLINRGDRARDTGFPDKWAYGQFKPNPEYSETKNSGLKYLPDPKIMPLEYDPSLPFGMIWRRDWQLEGNYTIQIDVVIKAIHSKSNKASESTWEQHQPGYGLLGLCFGGECLFESWYGGGKPGDASWMALWRDDGRFGLYSHTSDVPETAVSNSEKKAPILQQGECFTLELAVTAEGLNEANVIAKLITRSKTTVVSVSGIERQRFTDGYFGIVGRGLLDFEVSEVRLDPGANQPVHAPINDLRVCYPLGDQLRNVDGVWKCRFIAMFRSQGKRVDIRVSDVPDPSDGWKNVPISGSADIITNDFRLNTASIDVTLPYNPVEKTMYYTVWKDGVDETPDSRSGYLGVKKYVGRLPRLKAPYRLCGLGGHAIHEGNPIMSHTEQFQENWVHGQPAPDAYKYLEDYDFQIMLWEDDVWYLELLFYPPSVDDAYKVINLTIANPTSRWQMMSHWNVINPGDHDYGMDDVKGPEQFIIRQQDGLGQDCEYMRRNFQIVNHLTTGYEHPDGTENPKNWRRWKMPDQDFSLLIMDARLWRTSVDMNLWGEAGWGRDNNFYDRTNPTRTLLGEEQFSWFERIIRTDTSPLICVTGLNVLHTIWRGRYPDPEFLSPADKSFMDQAGWVKAGTDRVIHLMGSRAGITTVFGDIHLCHISKDVTHRFYECSFGAIGRYGAREIKPDFGPRMKDYDGRDLEIIALYHDQYDSPTLRKRKEPRNFGFLEMQFDPRSSDPVVELKIRNLIDPPGEEPRGGGIVKDKASNSGRPVTCKLPNIKTIPNANVYFSSMDGQPIMGIRSLDNGSLPISGFIDVDPGTSVIMTVVNEDNTDVQILKTKP